MRYIILTITLMLALSSCTAQKSQPVPDDMKPLFPTAQSVTPKGSLYTVNGPDGALLGYAAYSKPASDGIRGFKGETPLLVAFSPDKKIQQVCLLPNQDTPNFVERVRKGGLLSAWDGLTLKQAKAKKVDAIAGATFTSNGIINTMMKTLENINL